MNTWTLIIAILNSIALIHLFATRHANLSTVHPTDAQQSLCRCGDIRCTEGREIIVFGGAAAFNFGLAYFVIGQLFYATNYMINSSLINTCGDIFHGRLSLDQLFSARPMLGMGQYATEIRGLYLCGSGTHPGGGVSGIPGHNAAREIARAL